MIRRLSIVGPLFSFIAATSSWASGFYMGAGVGPEIANFRVTSHVSQVHNGIPSFSVKNDDQLSGTGAFGTVFAGYGKKLSELGFQPNNLYFAGELNANLSSLQHQNSNEEFIHKTSSSTTYRMRYGFGASILPGYFYTDTTLFYGRLGYANGNFKVSTSDASLASINKNLSGFRWGLGLQQTVASRLAVRIEYSNISYNSTTVSTFDSLSAVSKKTQFTPHVNEVEFGLVYKFC